MTSNVSLVGKGSAVQVSLVRDDPRLPNHTVVLKDDAVRLRPLTEDDWPTLLRWNQDAEVLWWSEGDDVKERTAEEVQGIYRGMAAGGHLFIIECPAGKAVGEICVQRMNLPRRLVPGKTIYRLPICIGEKHQWGQGIGKRAARLALRFAFETLGADMVCGVDVSSANLRSVNLWRSLGLSEIASCPQPNSKHGPESRSVDFAIDRETWRALGPGS